MAKNGTTDLHNVAHEHLHIPASDKLAATAKPQAAHPAAVWFAPRSLI